MHYCLDQVKQKKFRGRLLFFNFTFVCLLSIFFIQEQALSKTNVYKQVRPDGQIEYSDKPTQESRQVVLPQIQIDLPAAPSSAPEVKINAPTLGEETSTIEKQEKINIRISSPMDQQVFIAVVTEVPVAVLVEPKLNPLQKIALILDNKPYSEPQNTNAFILKDLERGAHELKAVVLDEQNKVLATSVPVIFHQQRHVIKK